MKTKTLFTTFAIVLLMIIAFTTLKSKTSKVYLSNLTLNNIEALANAEVIIETPCMQIHPMPLCVYLPDEGIIIFGVPYDG